MNIPSKPGPFYLLMEHVPTGERYAFRLERPFTVTGCLGPRNRLQWQGSGIDGLDYDADRSLVLWANEHIKEFDLTL